MGWNFTRKPAHGRLAPNLQARLASLDKGVSQGIWAEWRRCLRMVRVNFHMKVWRRTSRQLEESVHTVPDQHAQAPVMLANMQALGDKGIGYTLLRSFWSTGSKVGRLWRLWEDTDLASMVSVLHGFAVFTKGFWTETHEYRGIPIHPLYTLSSHEI